MTILQRLQALITSLTSDKSTLVTNLTGKGVTAATTESLSDLVAKVAEIEGVGDLEEPVTELETLVNGTGD
jgi:hypothetical protein